MADPVTAPQVAIVVPCYNESRRLPADSFREFLREARVYLVFVDDGSQDNTFEVLERLRAENEDQVVVLGDRVNRGKAEAVRRGFSYCLKQNFDYIGFWDADLATPLDAIAPFLAVLERRPRVDMIFGARVKLLGRNVERLASRHYLGRIFATVVSTILRLPIYDTQCGAKIFRVGPHTRGLFEEPFVSRWVFDVELIARYIRSVGSSAAAASGIYEYPLETWVDVKGSKVKPFDFFIAFWDVVRIYGKYLRASS